MAAPEQPIHVPGRRGSLSAQSIAELEEDVNRDSISFDEVSSEDEEQTQTRVRRGFGLKPEQFGVPLRTPGTTENDSAPIFVKPIFDLRKPRITDIESAPSTSSSTVVPATAHAIPPAVPTRTLHVFEVLHNWTKVSKDGLAIPAISVVERPAREAHQIRGHVSWLHAEEHLQTLQALEDLFKTFLAPGLAHHIQLTTQSLLNRVKTTKERNYVGGKFMIAGPIRYDGKLSQDDTDDRPCLFFSFPYLAVGNFKRKSNDTSRGIRGSGTRSSPSKKSPLHPVRTLLQSRYRLESTKKRDGNQSILALSREDIQDCIGRPPGITQPLGSGKWKEKIHVPHFWGLSISGDTMITSGPISEIELRGSALVTKETASRRSRPNNGPSLVRFNLEHKGKSEAFTYPADQCEWYFGLLNKERGILAELDDKTGKYSLYHRKGKAKAVLVNPGNWIDVLRSNPQDEQLDLWMERQPESGLPHLEVTSHTEKQSNGLDKGSQPQDDTIVDPQTLSPDVQAQGKDVQPLQENITVNPQNLSPDVQAQDKGVRPVQENITVDPQNFPTDVQAQGTEVKSATATRPSSIHLRAPSHNRSASRGTGRFSIASISSDLELPDPYAFLQWPFEEEKDGNTRLPIDRVKLWLNKSTETIMAKHGNEIDDDLFGCTPDAANQNPQFKKIVYSERDTVQNRVSNAGDTLPVPASAAQNGNTSPAPIDPQPTVAKQVAVLFGNARRLLKLFVPEKLSQHHQILKLYWGMMDRIITNIIGNHLSADELAAMQKAMSDLISLAEILHKGVRKYTHKYDDGSPEAKETVNVASAVIFTPIPAAFDYIIAFLFHVARYSSTSSPDDHREHTVFYRAVGLNLKKAKKSLVTARNYLITAADESATEKQLYRLGPTVTPEAIILILLERLSGGVYRNGSIDVIEIYDRVVEKLALQVERRASRHLLLEINRVSEELEIIIDVFKQQEKFFDGYRELLDPESFTQPSSVRRRIRFPFESEAIDRNLKLVREHISYCKELQSRIARLSDQNVRLVETYQDDNNKTLLIFTVVTITFLPLSFVTGFFGMNLEGISGTHNTVLHFWVIAIPVTVGVALLSAVLIYWGAISRELARLWSWWKSDFD